MARDCPDRQRGSDWRNSGYSRGPRAIGAGDAVDREMEQLMHELSGGAPGEEAPRRIEAGPGHAYDDRDMKPWQQRGPPSDVAPWQQRGRDNRSRDDYGSRDYGNQAPWAAQSHGGDYGYGAPGGGYGAPGVAPWQQQAPPPPPPGGQSGYGYGGYPAYAPGMAAPGAPGMGVPPPPPGMPSMYGTPPPPPPPADGPPPPVSSYAQAVPKFGIINANIVTASFRSAPAATSTCVNA